MAGPMSAPNGDRGLIRNDPHERFIETGNKDNPTYVPAREYYAKRGRLYTGKTERKKK